jgi:hypothetical protein
MQLADELRELAFGCNTLGDSRWRQVLVDVS